LACTTHSNWLPVWRATAQVTSSRKRGSSMLWKRRYSPVLPMRSISTGLCSSGWKGPITPLRGPSMSTCAAARCSGVMASAAGIGMRSAQGWEWPCSIMRTP
jgi:hypothetical protein